MSWLWWVLGGVAALAVGFLIGWWRHRAGGESVTFGGDGGPSRRWKPKSKKSPPPPHPGAMQSGAPKDEPPSPSPEEPQPQQQQQQQKQQQAPQPSESLAASPLEEADAGAWAEEEAAVEEAAMESAGGEEWEAWEEESAPEMADFGEDEAGGGPFAMAAPPSAAPGGGDAPEATGAATPAATPGGEPVEAGAETVTHERVPHMDLDPGPGYAPGDRFVVEVYVDREAMRAGESGETMTITAPREQERFDLDVWLVVERRCFALDGPPTRTVSLDLGAAESERARFEVRVRDDAPPTEGARLSASFSVDGRPSGRVERRVDVGVVGAVTGVETGGEAGEERRTAGAAEATVGDARRDGAETGGPDGSTTPVGTDASFADLVRDAALGVPGEEDAPPRPRLALTPGVAADLVVRVVAQDASGMRYSCHVRTPLLPDLAGGVVGDWELPTSTRDLVVDKMKDFSAKGVSPFARRVALQAAGEGFFDAAPEVFRDAFWRLVDERPGELTTVAVVADEPHVPWELMIPTRPRPGGGTEERRPLGVEFVVSRWTARDHVLPPQTLPLSHTYVVAPGDSGLKEAEDEAAMVLGGFAGERIAPASMQALDDFLGRRGSTLLHFICHGLSKDGKQVIQLENREELPAYFLRGMPGVQKALATERPLVFLNACQVGRQEAGLVGPEGFAQAFMALGAGGVVAALWSVKDDLAHQLATDFYRRVQEEPETPYAEILRDLRARSYEGREAEDTWAAYCFYGDPLAARQGPSATDG